MPLGRTWVLPWLRKCSETTLGKVNMLFDLSTLSRLRLWISPPILLSKNRAEAIGWKPRAVAPGAPVSVT